jgi:hypothetical protein
MGEHCGGWHGGILDLRTGEEYVRCPACDVARQGVETLRQIAGLGCCSSGEFERRFGTNPKPAFVEPPAFVTKPADRIATMSDDTDKIMGELVKMFGVPAGIISDRMPEGAYARYPRNPDSKAERVAVGGGDHDCLEDEQLGIGG